MNRFQRAPKWGLIGGLLTAIFLWGFAFLVLAAPPSLSVTTNRVSGKPPLFVVFDATGTTDPDLTKPIHHLTYCFDDNTGSTELYRNVADNGGAGPGGLDYGKVTERDRTCGAPLLGRVFEASGNMTITARDQENETDSTSMAITITPWTAAETECVRRTGSDFTGCPFTTGQGATHTTSTDFDATIAAAIAGGRNRVLFHCNDTFDVSTTVNISAGGVHIGGYDNGGRSQEGRFCQFTISGSSVSPLFNFAQGDDSRITDFTWTGVSTNDLQQHAHGTSGDTDNVLFQNVTATNIGGVHGNIFAQDNTLPQYWGYVTSTFTDCGHAATTADKCFATATEYLMIIDTIVDGDLSNNTSHLHRFFHCEDTWVHGSKYGPESGASQDVITLRAFDFNGAAGPTGRWSENCFFSDNWFVGGQQPWMFQMAAQNGTGQVPNQRNVILERNYCSSSASLQQLCYVFSTNGTANDYTFRHEIADSLNGYSQVGFAMDFGLNNPTSGLELYNITFLERANGVANLWQNSSNCTARNNVLFEIETGTTQMFNNAACSGGKSNNYANDAETGVTAIGNTCPYRSCTPTSLSDYQPLVDHPNLVDGGIAIPYRCDFAREDFPEGTPDAGAYEQGSSTDVCVASASPPIVTSPVLLIVQ